MKNFFSGCETLEDLKARYHKLAKENHPDNGGDVETMKAINAEFDALHAKLKNTHRKQDGTTWTAEAGSNAETAEKPEEFREMIDKLLRHNLTIEIIGCFVWVYGDTKPVKDELKSLGFRWHSKKLSWYLKPAEYRKKGKKEYSFDEIRNMYNVRGVFHGNEEQHNEYQPAPVF